MQLQHDHNSGHRDEQRCAAKPQQDGVPKSCRRSREKRVHRGAEPDDAAARAGQADKRGEEREEHSEVGQHSETNHAIPGPQQRVAWLAAVHTHERERGQDAPDRGDEQQDHVSGCRREAVHQQGHHKLPQSAGCTEEEQQVLRGAHADPVLRQRQGHAEDAGDNGPNRGARQDHERLAPGDGAWAARIITRCEGLFRSCRAW
mmetsp:Transcript_29659/g.78555  ORF Transcript_29659/g.78555 Transcript_29659/m.78555 type:complete len:203 (+) Transcript_29659:166-774(+)